jgi:hypothetical protein
MLFVFLKYFLSFFVNQGQSLFRCLQLFWLFPAHLSPPLQGQRENLVDVHICLSIVCLSCEEAVLAPFKGYEVAFDKNLYARWNLVAEGIDQLLRSSKRLRRVVLLEFAVLGARTGCFTHESDLLMARRAELYRGYLLFSESTLLKLIAWPNEAR